MGDGPEGRGESPARQNKQQVMLFRGCEKISFCQEKILDNALSNL